MNGISTKIYEKPPPRGNMCKYIKARRTCKEASLRKAAFGIITDIELDFGEL
jgi:hypothetical protein